MIDAVFLNHRLHSADAGQKMSGDEAFDQGRIVYLNRGDDSGSQDAELGQSVEQIGADLDQATPAPNTLTDWRGGEILSYLQDLSRECAQMAEAAGFATLAGLYRLATEEAQRCGKDRR
ncbi:MAG: hypothetical protein ABL898_12590 [Hyphomicrobiaceae bacterium]|nr:hypothetical protein [Hyphomicrobiaceae bacterium]